MDVGHYCEVLLWFKLYLDSSKLVVFINGHLSKYLPVASGVPQGSILCPLLFLVLMFDYFAYLFLPVQTVAVC